LLTLAWRGLESDIGPENCTHNSDLAVILKNTLFDC
jgi:hypothetical protein